MEMDVSAEGPFVDLGLLLKALGCNGISVFLDRRADVPISILETKFDDKYGTLLEPLASIHM